MLGDAYRMLTLVNVFSSSPPLLLLRFHTSSTLPVHFKGWTPEMDGYLEYGVRWLPAGILDVHNARLVNPGKQWPYSCGRDVCWWQYPAFFVNGAHQPLVTLNGLSVETPITGKLVDGYRSITMRDNVLLGIEVRFGGTRRGGASGPYYFKPSRSDTYTFTDNLLLAEQRCRMTCTFK